jgi:hypothetical protein
MHGEGCSGRGGGLPRAAESEEGSRAQAVSVTSDRGIEHGTFQCGERLLVAPQVNESLRVREVDTHARFNDVPRWKLRR